MNFNFPAILAFAVFITGGIWAVDALFFASRRRMAATMLGGEDTTTEKGKRPNEPMLVEYARALFPIILAVFVLRSFLVEPFKIPSGSMVPTLLIGDFILVNKFAYGIRLPVLNNKVIDIGEPERGDVTVFRFPGDPSIDYIKRIVGLPGDRISYRNKVLYLNGKPMKRLPLGRYTDENDARMSGDRYEEDLQGVKHSILINPARLPMRPGNWIVPEGHYFAMGDNRDNSNDSRFWGFVPEENLVGKAFFVWMNFSDFGRMGESIE